METCMSPVAAEQFIDELATVTLPSRES